MRVPRPLLEMAWATYANSPDECVVRPSIPILYFGDSAAYARSPLKVVTVALNPSHHEFPESDRFARFPLARQINHFVMDEPDQTNYRAALDAYFREKPYRRWFGWFEEVLVGMGSSYYDGQSSMALHTDLCSPLATNPTWSRLGTRRETLDAAGIALWHRLVDVLAPDIIVISVARHCRDQIAFVRSAKWEPPHTIPRADPTKRPYHALTQQVALPSGKQTLLLFGQAAQKPFATLHKASRRAIGRAAREALDAG